MSDVEDWDATRAYYARGEPSFNPCPSLSWLRVCSWCGAAVADEQLHTAWHREAAS